MKQATLLKLIISIVLCYLQQTALAQSKWQFGVYAGGNVSKLKPGELAENPAYPFAEQYKWTPSYNLGAYTDLLISKKLYFESGVNIISKNSDAVPKLILKAERGYYNSNNVFERFNKSYFRAYNYQSTALQIPLTLHAIILQKSNFKVNIYAGVLWENILSLKLNVVNTSEWDSLPPKFLFDDEAAKQANPNYLSGYKYDENSFTRSNIGSVFGLGCSFNKIGVDLGMNNPIRNYTSVQYKNSSITFNVRYQIK
jgi:hypothetical protein